MHLIPQHFETEAEHKTMKILMWIDVPERQVDPPCYFALYQSTDRPYRIGTPHGPAMLSYIRVQIDRIGSEHLASVGVGV